MTEKFNKYLDAIDIAYLKMKEFDPTFGPDRSEQYKQGSILVKEYTFEKPKTFKINCKEFTSISAKILLVKQFHLFGIQFIFDREENSFFFEMDSKTAKNLTPLVQLEKNNILPDPEVFINILSFRSIEGAEFFGCDGWNFIILKLGIFLSFLD